MQVIRRFRQVQMTIEKPVVRLRHTSNRLEKLAEDRQTIMENLKLISDSDEAIDRAQIQKDAALAKIEELMKLHKINVQDNGEYIAELKETFTRQQRTIHPDKFRTKVTNKQFWASIEVSISKASELLGAKELDAISDVVPAQSQGVHLKVRELKTKNKRGA